MLGNKLRKGNFYFRFGQGFELEGFGHVHKGKETLYDALTIILRYERNLRLRSPLESWTLGI
jgi:hypothetical protein